MIDYYKSKSIIFLLMGMLLYSATAYSQDEWLVPQDEKVKLAPFKFDTATVNQGKTLWDENKCSSCHGNPGEGNNLPMNPIPYDAASDNYQSNTDGELYFKISEGRITMPSFKNKMDASQRWALISYIRSFNKSYVQAEPVIVELSNSDIPVEIELDFDKEKNSLKAKLSQTINNEKQAATGYQVSLYAKRHFGNLIIDKTRTSDTTGNATFVLPDDLPGDKEGNISLVVKVENAKSDKTVNKEQVLQFGTPSKHVNILDQRAMWNVRSMAPLWLVLSYTLVVLGVVSTLLYIVMLIYKVWDAGKTNKPLN